MTEEAPPPQQQPPAGAADKPTMAQRAQGAAGEADVKLQKTLDNKLVAGTESFADGLFSKMGLQPTDVFCCCAPSMCGLRTIVLILSVIQAVYGGCVLMVAIFSSLWRLIVFTASLQILSIIFHIFSFIFQLIIGSLYLAAGIYGMKATSSLEKVTSLSPEIVTTTQYYYKLNLLAFLFAVLLCFITAIFQSVILYKVMSIIFYWIWFLVYCAWAAYVLYILWSYTHWITAAAANGGRNEALSKAVKFSSQTPAPPPPPAQPVSVV